MATSSITKEFYVKDQTAFERLKKELDAAPTQKRNVVKSTSLEKGRKKLVLQAFHRLSHRHPP